MRPTSRPGPGNAQIWRQMRVRGKQCHWTLHAWGGDRSTKPWDSNLVNHCLIHAPPYNVEAFLGSVLWTGREVWCPSNFPTIEEIPIVWKKKKPNFHGHCHWQSIWLGMVMWPQVGGSIWENYCIESRTFHMSGCKKSAVYHDWVPICGGQVIGRNRTCFFTWEKVCLNVDQPYMACYGWNRTLCGMHWIASGRDLVLEVCEGKWRSNTLPMWTFVLSEPGSTLLAYQALLPTVHVKRPSVKRL